MKYSENRYHHIIAALPAVLAAAALCIHPSVHACAEAAESAGWEAVSAGETADDIVPEEVSIPSEEEYLAESPDEDQGIRREKYYLLEAMDRLQDLGLSPIMIWSRVSGNEKVLNMVNGPGKDAVESVTDAVTQKVTEAGSAAAGKAGEIVQGQTEKVKQSLWERIREQIRNFFHSPDGG